MINQEELERIIKGLTDLNDDICLIHDKKLEELINTYTSPETQRLADAIQKVEMAIVLLEKLQRR